MNNSLKRSEQNSQHGLSVFSNDLWLVGKLLDLSLLMNYRHLDRVA